MVKIKKNSKILPANIPITKKYWLSKTVPVKIFIKLGNLLVILHLEKELHLKEKKTTCLFILKT